MNELCPIEKDSEIYLSDFNQRLTKIRLQELRKDRRAITPNNPVNSVKYPSVAPGDVIETIGESGEQVVHLIIQYNGNEYTTYRLDDNGDGRYEFLSDKSLLSICEVSGSVIHHDPFNLRVSVQKGNPIPALC